MQPGSLVLCIDAGNWPPGTAANFNSLPKEGEIYHVREIIDWWDGTCIKPGIALEEIYGRIHRAEKWPGVYGHLEAHFKMSRFVELPAVGEEAEEEEESLCVPVLR